MTTESVQNPMFDSCSASFRYPVGAVGEGTNLHFKILLPRSLGCSSAQLVLRCDTQPGERFFDLFWCAMEGEEHEWWEMDYCPESPGIYWYTFLLRTNGGTRSIQRGLWGESQLDSGGSWQLTVFEKEFTTPSWLAGGVMYQIFPDRFYASNTPKKDVPEDRTLRSDWGGEPEWRPDARGRVTNADYFGGDLEGITQKLDYLDSLGVTCLYLNPIFEAHSNHRYNTADYTKIDPLLGTEEEFKTLCREAKMRGMSVLLDGVFSHTGDDSLYFNRYRRYPGEGAYNSPTSPYSHWYRFDPWPDRYQSWWGFESLPEVNELSNDFNEFINGKGGVVQKWLDLGASGWRLDVADELPDAFLDSLRRAAKEQDPDALILGEVWEDASHKQAYGQTRRYLLGKQLDSVMNYPFRELILGFISGQMTGPQAFGMVRSILENYPRQVLRVLMNHIGTHDTERALTLLGGEAAGERGREWQSAQKLTAEQRAKGLLRLRAATLMQFTLPGVPCIYYGDEAGVEGYRDPFNRTCYPWGEEDLSLLDWYRNLGRLRKKAACLKDGEFTPFLVRDRQLGYIRSGEGQRLLVLLNADDQPFTLTLPKEWASGQVLAGASPEKDLLTLPPCSYSALFCERPADFEKSKTGI